MCRTANLVASLFFLAASLAIGQEAQPTHPFPEDAFTTRDLVAWSYLQTPQPAPQPTPPPDDHLPRPDQQRISQPEALLFVGKVVKDSGTYTLQVSNSIYLLDGNVGAGNENQTVKVIGNQDKSSATIHVLRIERLP
ncbi:MAG TPA: hypothetical protein VHW45_19930 [Candidatus Sulfotelmatobacter sp.]|jgi:hypothetical protein|nr:hypothetical protein [Candidatus Sulfotelmatobacter sp.]